MAPQGQALESFQTGAKQYIAYNQVDFSLLMQDCCCVWEPSQWNTACPWYEHNGHSHTISVDTLKNRRLSHSKLTQQTAEVGGSASLTGCLHKPSQHYTRRGRPKPQFSLSRLEWTLLPWLVLHGLEALVRTLVKKVLVTGPWEHNRDHVALATLDSTEQQAWLSVRCVPMKIETLTRCYQTSSFKPALPILGLPSLLDFLSFFGCLSVRAHAHQRTAIRSQFFSPTVDQIQAIILGGKCLHPWAITHGLSNSLFTF